MWAVEGFIETLKINGSVCGESCDGDSTAAAAAAADDDDDRGCDG